MDQNYKNTCCLIIFIIIIAVIAYYSKMSKEKFCGCRGLQDTKYCADPKMLTQLYEQGRLTETNFPQIPGNNSPGWSSIMPMDQFDQQMGWN